MTEKPQKKPKLTDADRYRRFVEAAREVEASEDADDFDKAFEKVTASTLPTGPKDAR